MLVLDHIGVVVRSIDDAVLRWESVLGYKRMTRTITNRRQKVNVAFLSKEGSLQVKLIEPTDESSSIQALARRGGGLHHLCFRCDSVGNEVDRMRQQRVTIVSPPEPGDAFENEQVAFVYLGDGLTVELIDTLKRAGVLAGTDSTDYDRRSAAEAS
jgi:methylmalonyl-CoA/ethylmalonyl-CoA epimerase